MDQAEFEALIRQAEANLPPAPASQQPAPVGQAQSIDANTTLGDLVEAGGDLLQNMSPDQARMAALKPATQAELEAQLKAQQDPNYKPPALTADQKANALGDPTGLDALTGGALKGVFEMGDTIRGETPKDQRSAFRQSVEQTVDLRKGQSMVDGFAAGIGQFGIAMLGLGKVTAPLKTMASGKAALWGFEAGKAAVVGATAFDPHEERLSNLVQGTPLANPVTAWLAADKDDTELEGRLKSAMESIGLDATLAGVFFGAGKVLKYAKAGDMGGAGRAADDMKAARDAAVEPQPNALARDELADDLVPNGAADDMADVDLDDLMGTSVVDDGGEAVAKTSEAGAHPLANVDPRKVSPAMAAKVEAEDFVSEALPPGQTGRVAAEAPYSPAVQMTVDDTAAVLEGAAKDAEAMATHGGWYQAIEAGHTFGRGEAIPYRKLNSAPELDDFMARAVDAAEEKLDILRGGKTLPDAEVNRVVDSMSKLYGADPATVLGQIQAAGQGASKLVANMEAGYLISTRMFQDSYALASRIRMGDFTQFGSKEAAMEELRQMTSLAVSIYGSSRAITAAGGRAVRRMRGEFKVDPEAVTALGKLDGEDLLDTLIASEGKARDAAKALNPTWVSKTTDRLQYLYVNNLVMGLKTHLVNVSTNALMVVGRPLERMVGSAVQAARGAEGQGRIFKEAAKQYGYLGAAFSDGFSLAIKAFKLNDSVLSPHQAEAFQGVKSEASAGFQAQYKPWSSPSNLLHNALVTVGVPGTRTLGMIDEAVKQTVYRSKIMAGAHMDAIEQGAELGLKGSELKAFVSETVQKRLDESFDDLGRATNQDALYEAQVATFQQPLLPGTLGKSVSTFTQNHPAMRFVLPFVKTPTNILRYGWKMTPGLNLLQSEYREALKGARGAEAKAQASGQMVLGGLFMGSAAYMASSGRITGGGPKDYKQREQLVATGWQPYSLVVENDDGSKTYVPFGRFDPIAIPFGIIADIQDAINANEREDDPKIEEAIGALTIALAKQFTSKTYMTGLNQALEAMQDPDRNFTKASGQMASNFVPFAGLLRWGNPDEYLRDARSITDKLRATIPGLSDDLPAKYDAFGDPIQRVGLWSTSEDQDVDREVQRLIVEHGAALQPPQPNRAGVDLRELVMSDGSNAYEKLQQFAGHPPKGPSLKTQIAKRMASERYQLAPDGDAGTKGTKLWLLQDIAAKYRERATKLIMRDPKVREAFRKDELKARDKFRMNKIAADARKNGLAGIGAAFGQDL